MDRKKDLKGSASAVRPDGVRELERLNTVAPGTVATADGTTRGLSLRLAFSDGSTFVVTPGADKSSDDEEDDAPLADWELLTPPSRLLSVGPGDRWSRLDCGSTRDASPSATPPPA